MKTIVILILSLILLSASCKKKNKNCSKGYELEHPVSVYPVQDSYSTGDTIWFEMNFSNEFNALVTNNYTGTQEYQTIQLNNFDFHRTLLHFSKIIDTTINTNGQGTEPMSDFTVIPVTGEIIYTHPDAIEYKYSFASLSYNFKVGIVCNQSGRYVCRPGFGHYYPASESQLNEQDLTSDCEKEIITDINFPVNKQSNGSYLTNYQIFQQFMNPALESDLERIKKESFTFVVN